MPSFDIVSELDWAEIKNALNQADKEVSQRFDFKGAQASYERVEGGIILRASTDDRVRAAWEVLQQKLVRRKVSLKHFEAKDPEPGPKGTAKMLVVVTEGIDKDKGREIVKVVKGTKLKVQAAIQEDSVRVTGKKRDELQAAIQELKQGDFGLELQFKNFRD